MDHVRFLEDKFKSIPDYKKMVLFLFSINKDDDLLFEYDFLKKCCYSKL